MTDPKLIVKDTDKKWAEVAKRIINALIDYASKTGKFRTVRIGEHSEMDETPGFYITFPGLDDQRRIAYERTEHTFRFECVYKIKGTNYHEALQELLELHGEMLYILDLDHDMVGIPEGVPTIGVPEVYDVEIVGLATGSDARASAPQSFEHLLGLTAIVIKAKVKLRG